METWLVKHSDRWSSRISDTILQQLIESWVKLEHRLPLSERKGLDRPPSTLTEMSRELMALHYDMPIKLFEGFLGPSMKYSMALWEQGAHTLENAQEAMLTDTCKKAGLEDGQTVLDIGCGFGSLATYILENFPQSQVYGLNLSQVQCQYIRNRQADPKCPLHSKRFHLLEGNFNDFRYTRRFDRIVSLGFFEHVANLGAALERLAALLEKNGRAFLHFITRQSPANPSYIPARSSGFIQDLIFPGSRIYQFAQIFYHQDPLFIQDSWFLNGKNYQLTIESWLQNFMRDRELIKERTALNSRTLKIWEVYLRACIALFQLEEGELYGNGQYVLARE